jgi:hypothetical protein
MPAKPPQPAPPLGVPVLGALSSPPPDDMVDEIYMSPCAGLFLRGILSKNAYWLSCCCDRIDGVVGTAEKVG